jgi:hypothetical protein
VMRALGVVWPCDFFEPSRNWRWTNRWIYLEATLPLMRFVLGLFPLGLD